MTRAAIEIIKSSDITPEDVFMSRRRLLASATAAGLVPSAFATASMGRRFEQLAASEYSTDAEPTDYEDVTSYNNFYEFGTGKDDPARNAGTLKTRPWTVTVDGEAEKTGQFDLDDILGRQSLEERIYRFRCVEAWSMVVPWVGFELSKLLQQFQPTSRAKYVQFETLFDPDQMPGQRYPVLRWPYVEGLTIGEAMNPLSLMAVGIYGRELPNQNGAPLRLVVPWKYGFKSIKSIVRISFTEQQPRTSWNIAAPHEYGFYANVNPNVDHPRWSQARERPIGGGLFASRIPTQLFNGYGEQVADLYRDLDLARHF